MEKTTEPPALSPPKDTRFTRRMMYVRHLLKRALLIRRGFSLSTLGEQSAGCEYTFCPEGLGPESVVYSGGVGKDISFEHALVEKFGCSIVLFDPSPIGLETMRQARHQIPQFRFLPVGLAGQCGSLRLAPPFSPEGDSWFSYNSQEGTIEVPCLDLVTLMNQNDHRAVDLLKIDIEGAEYGVVDQILNQSIPVRQIIVEFHDGILPGIRLRHSLRAIVKLLGRGYKLIWDSGNVHTFLWGGSWHNGKVAYSIPGRRGSPRSTPSGGGPHSVDRPQDRRSSASYSASSWRAISTQLNCLGGGRNPGAAS